MLTVPTKRPDNPREWEYHSGVIYTVWVDDQPFTCKPTGGAVAGVKRRARKAVAKPMSLQTLVDRITAGHSWSPVVSGPDGKKSPYQLLVLRFRGKRTTSTTLEDVLQLCKEYEIEPCLAYHTFEHSWEKPQFYMVWKLDLPVDDPERLIESALAEMLKRYGAESPVASMGVCYGTNTVPAYINESFKVAPEGIMDAYQEHAFSRNPANAARAIQAFAHANDLIVTGNGVLDIGFADPRPEGTVFHRYYQMTAVSDESSPDSPREQTFVEVLIYYKLDSVSSAVEGESASVEEVRGHPRDGKKPYVRLEHVKDKCLLLNALASGGHVRRSEVHGLATRLVRVNGGERLLREALAGTECWSSGAREGLSTFAIRKAKEYLTQTGNESMKCDEFCNRRKGCDCSTSWLERAVPWSRLFIDLGDESGKDPMTYAEAKAQCKTEFERALNVEGNSVYLISAPPGAGKTESYIGVKNAIVALPTHELAKEIAGRFRKDGHEVILVPREPELPPDVRDKVDSYYKVGAANRALRVMRRYAKNHPDNTDLKEYLDILDSVGTTTNTVIMTHKKLLHLKNTKHEAVIIDEDYLPTAICQASVDYSALLYLERALNQRGDRLEGSVRERMKQWFELFHEAVDTMAESATGEWPRKFYEKSRLFSTTHGMKVAPEHLMDFAAKECPKIRGNIVQLFHCDYFLISGSGGMERVHCVTRPRFPSKKTIVLSATASRYMYWSVLGDRLEIRDIGPVDTKGEVVQYIRHSFSKDSLRDHEKRGERTMEVREEIGEKTEVITHKNLTEDELLRPLKDIYFFNLLGTNNYAEKDIAVVGTPRLPDYSYILWAAALGIETCPEQWEYGKIDILSKGRFMPLQSFHKCEELAKLQVEMIRGELLQAVGRARPITEACKVYVFSNVPVKGATIVD